MAALVSHIRQAPALLPAPQPPQHAVVQTHRHCRQSGAPSPSQQHRRRRQRWPSGGARALPAEVSRAFIEARLAVALDTPALREYLSELADAVEFIEVGRGEGGRAHPWPCAQPAARLWWCFKRRKSYAPLKHRRESFTRATTSCQPLPLQGMGASANAAFLLVKEAGKLPPEQCKCADSSAVIAFVRCCDQLMSRI